MKSYSDIQGDGGSRIVEQVVAQKNKIEKNLSPIRHIVAVASGKGGVGKSTLTRHLASVLQLQNRRVAILDADFNGPTQAKMAGIRSPFFIPGQTGIVLPKTKEGVGVVSLGALFPETTAIDFESVAPGESFIWRATKEFSVLSEILGEIEWGELDVLLLDLPPGPERTAQYAEFFGKKLSFVLVTIPSDVSHGVVARSIAALKKTGSPILGYIENMKGYYCPDCKKIKPLFPSEANGHLGISRLGSVPFDPQLALMCDRGIALNEGENLPATIPLKEISKKILALLEETR